MGNLLKCVGGDFFLRKSRFGMVKFKVFVDSKLSKLNRVGVVQVLEGSFNRILSN